LEKFHFISFAQEVVFGAGSLVHLRESVDPFGWQRLMLCTNRSMKINGHAASLEAALGDRLIATFDHVAPHVQDIQVAEVLALAEANKIDAVIGMGGGSPIGMAKAIAHALDEKHAGDLPSIGAPLIPVVAIPTTYAGSEMTPTFGITHTDEVPPRKVTVTDPKIAPRLVVYDPELTLDLPAELSASSGINALAHCIEALYSITRNPLSTAAAIHAVHYITRALLRCYQDGKNLDARTEMLTGAHLAGISLSSVTMGLHHGLCHVLGGSANIPHGIANSIILPHAVRFNADAAASDLIPAAAVMGVSTEGRTPATIMREMAQKIFDLIGQMNLPQRLRDAGVKESELAALAQIAFKNRTVQNNPKPITDVIQIERLLTEAW
jgi:alcohol dehydrogenase class IV